VLENEIGVELFDRSKRAISLTAAGTRFLEDALRVLDEAHRAESNAKKAARGILGRLNLGYMLSTAHELVANAVRTYKGLYPAVEINFLNLTNSEQIAALNERRIDIAFTRSRIDGQDLKTEVLLEEPMVMMVPETDPLAAKKRLDWTDLEGKTIVTLHPNQALGFYDPFFAKCAEKGVSVVTAQYANDIHTEMWMVSMGMGLSPTSLTTSYVKRPNLAYCHLPPELPTVQTVMTWRQAALFPPVLNFIEIMRKATKRKSSSR
jgi:DNA-binding transcriptional LysR family regulator